MTDVLFVNCMKTLLGIIIVLTIIFVVGFIIEWFRGNVTIERG